MTEDRYLCERCGGNGQQPQGCWNYTTGRYDSEAGVCETCGGSGRLGVIGCTCPTLSGVKVTGSSCKVHGLPKAEWWD